MPDGGTYPPTPELWEQALAGKGDKLAYDGLNLSLLSGEKELSTVQIAGGGGDVVPVPGPPGRRVLRARRETRAIKGTRATRGSRVHKALQGQPALSVRKEILVRRVKKETLVRKARKGTPVRKVFRAFLAKQGRKVSVETKAIREILEKKENPARTVSECLLVVLLDRS